MSAPDSVTRESLAAPGIDPGAKEPVFEAGSIPQLPRQPGSAHPRAVGVLYHTGSLELVLTIGTTRTRDEADRPTAEWHSTVIEGLTPTASAQILEILAVSKYAHEIELEERRVVLAAIEEAGR